MNSRTAKKIRKYSKRNFFEYVDAVRGWPFTNRWRLCWHILFSRKHEPKKLPRSKVLSQRRAVPSQ